MADVIDEILQDFFASRRVRHFGMKLEAEKFALRILDSGEVAPLCCANDAKTFRQRCYFVPVAVPDIELAAYSIEQFRLLRNVQHARAILPVPGENYFATKV